MTADERVSAFLASPVVYYLRLGQSSSSSEDSQDGGQTQMPDKSTDSGKSTPTFALKEVAVQFNYPETTPAYYARLFAAHADDHEIVLSVFDTRLPVFTGSAEQILAQSAALTSVRADCIVRLVIAPERIQQLMDVLTTAKGIYDQRQVSKQQGNQP